MNNKKPRFSIIICAYNIEEYISRAINSVLEQDFDDYELLLVNDGSKDKTLSILKKYANMNKDKIKLIDNEKNLGLGKSRNIAIEKARGEYIVHLDGDDTLYEKETLTKIDKTIGKEKTDLIYFGVKYVGGDNKAHIPTAENSTREARIICDMHFAVASKVWRREFLQKNDITFIEDMYYEDMVYSIKATILAKKLNYGAFPIYNYYRGREGSIMATPNIKRCKDMYKMLYYLMELYETTPKNLQPYLLSFINNETKSLPVRINAVLKSLEDNTVAPTLPKRNYKFEEKLCI